MKKPAWCGLGEGDTIGSSYMEGAMEKFYGWSWKDWLAMAWVGAFVSLAVLAIIPGYPTAWKWAGDNSANIASWVQAIGSIAAIIGAAHIANRQHRLQIAAEAERQEQVLAHRRELLKVAILGLRQTSVYLSERLDTDDADGRIQHYRRMYSSGANTVINFPILEIENPYLASELLTVMQFAHMAEIAFEGEKGAKSHAFRALGAACDELLVKFWPGIDPDAPT